jgi:transcriptional regulator with XRE-family HTH domain
VKRSHPVDCHVGQRVKLARLAKGMSQTSLGNAVGITFQQIQKYEKGTNRISASRLSQFAALLAVDIPFFFQGSDEQIGSGKNPDPDALNFNLSRADVAILRGLSEVEGGELKRKLLDLIKYIANPGRAPESASEV